MIGTVSTRSYAVVALLLMSNAAVFLLCYVTVGTPIIPKNFLVAHGALIPGAYRPEDLWRLIASGFLHTNPVHLLANLIALAVAGPFLEKRLGASVFTLVYFGSMAFAGLASVGLHSDTFVSVGASGGISGIVGALFALWVLGASDLSPGFFLANFGLNFAFSARDSNLDWAIHIGGLAAGLAGIAVLDTLTRTNALWLRCKFPEFVKMNAMILIGISAAWFYRHPPAISLPCDPRWATTGLDVFAVLVFIKLLDLLLSTRRGLIASVLVLALGNGLAAAAAWALLQSAVALDCRYAGEFGPATNPFTSTLCSNHDALPLAMGAIVFTATLVLYASHLKRGFQDVGFVAATFIGNRKRERSLVRPTVYTRV